MTVVKFDKHRGRKKSVPKRAFDPVKALAIAGAVISVLSAAVWLIRDARDLGSSFRPAEGSLVVNINTGTAEELISVPGLGATRAAQIIAGRPYESVDELERVAGIGEATLQSLRPFVTVEGDTRPFK